MLEKEAQAMPSEICSLYKFYRVRMALMFPAYD